MNELKRDLLTNKYTRIFCEDEKERSYNAPHKFIVTASRPGFHCGNPDCPFLFCSRKEPKTCSMYLESPEKEKVLATIHFQEGPIKECGVNGVCNEDLINMVIERLECFQNSEFKCRENEMAINKLEEALLWLRKRTMAREQRGVEGTHTI